MANSQINLLGYASVLARRIKGLKMVDDTTQPVWADEAATSFKIIDKHGGIVKVTLTEYKGRLG